MKKTGLVFIVMPNLVRRLTKIVSVTEFGVAWGNAVLCKCGVRSVPL